MKKAIWIVRNFIKQIKKDNINAFAASTGFFFFLSIFPMLFVLCSILPFTPLTEGNLIEAIIRFTPDSMDPLVISLVNQSYSQSANLLPVAIIVAIWSSGKGMLALMRGLNAVHGVEEEKYYFLERIRASVYMLITIVALLISLVLSVFGKIILFEIMKNMPYGEELFSDLMSGCSIFVWVFLIVAFSMAYTYVPNTKLKLRQQIPGAIFSAIGWNIFSYLFSIYVKHFGGSSIYGSFSTVIFLMIWLYCCIYIFLIGANMNRYFYPLICIFLPEKKKNER